jgi:tripartite-type tricarboxylate transporter receptor subunit TctC
MAEPSFQEFLVKGAFEVEPPLSTADYKRYVEDEMKRWRPIITTMGIKID